MNGKERIVAALHRHPVDRTPVWFMRQAGRHLPEYRKLAAEHSFWERCQDLDLCTNITMQPIQRYGMLDAAIVFSDQKTAKNVPYEGTGERRAGGSHDTKVPPHTRRTRTCHSGSHNDNRGEGLL